MSQDFRASSPIAAEQLSALVGSFEPGLIDQILLEDALEVNQDKLDVLVGFTPSPRLRNAFLQVYDQDSPAGIVDFQVAPDRSIVGTRQGQVAEGKLTKANYDLIGSVLDAAAAEFYGSTPVPGGNVQLYAGRHSGQSVYFARRHVHTTTKKPETTSLQGYLHIPEEFLGLTREQILEASKFGISVVRAGHMFRGEFEYEKHRHEQKRLHRSLARKIGSFLVGVASSSPIARFISPKPSTD